eukprot:CAMPEP_0180276418 /NCGR_PEP_ID=MMETSP0988-20121125/6350_1 /TAXON_ID=697907 /ORGANISM="non described non described, Strain CCMP2293" /LENGTH=87 /DNA_ID=CAMNT_0022247719 /DNA_START=607 /DNA_END=870 /DNA_ORIENTATION=+
MRVRCWQKRKRVDAWGSPWKVPDCGEMNSVWGVELVYAVCTDRVMSFEDFGDVVQEFRGGSNVGHSNEEPVVLDSIKCLHTIHGGGV